jgi:hypothetical protein
MTLEEIESRLDSTNDPAVLWGGIPGGQAAFLKMVKVLCHPDRYLDDAVALARADMIRRRVFELLDRASAPQVDIASPKRKYTLTRLLAVGDVSDVHLASAVTGGVTRDYVVKIARVPEGAGLLNNEQAVLTEILTKVARANSFSRYVPTLCESFAVKDVIAKRVNVFAHEPGFFTLEAVHARHPALDGRHIAWIFKRLLTAIGIAHRCGRVHGAVCPAHVQIHAENHGLQLLGWGHAVKIGGKITSGPAKYLSYFPVEVRRKRPSATSTDIFMAAMTMTYLIGGGVPEPIVRFLTSCLVEGPAMRPADAFALHDQFDEVLRGLYGPPKYHPLSMS